MSKFTGPKAKRCRRQGLNIYGSDKYDKIMQRKPQAPGKSPRARMGRRSEYARQLIEKQRARDMYGLNERQFLRLYGEAMRSKGKTGDTLKQLLEMRLDNVLYRAGFAMTRLQARQFAGHGIFMINGSRVKSPSYRIKPGEVITIREQTKGSPIFASILEQHAKYLPPQWLKVDSGKMQIEVVALPTSDDAEQAIDTRQIVEFYSRN